jgi:diguanylate cyclase (GGDEF)-like protein/putative nucleotidyltransferase with HDIG domain
MSIKARAYWLGIIIAGFVCLAWAGALWNVRHEKLLQFSIYMIAAVAASGMKIKLPGIPGTLSMNYLFIIVGLFELQLESAILIGVTSVLAQVLIRPRANPTWEQVLFSALSIPLPVAAADFVLHIGQLQVLDPTCCLALLSASMVYFWVNTSIVAVIVGLTTRQSPVSVWRENFIWTSPQYLVGGALAGGLHLVDRFFPWQGLLLSGPPLYLVYRSYSLYLGRVDQQQKHIIEMAQLHWRTIEALALAIEAKDDTTAAHLKRVQIYAVEIAKELQLTDQEIKAVEAASLLHDIGKLAVPEYIISKPGRLTPEEFDKMKIHPIVGAEILERVSFPYPVVPMVRSHHEKFDGTGYPDGLKGEDIPIGARILSAVDCLDALASDRQYRRAVPLDKAMEMVVAESGKAFDPKIVNLLQLRYKSLEAKARSESPSPNAKIGNVKVERGAAPATGLAAANVNPLIVPEAPFTMAIANARREVQLLVEITNDLGNSLSLDETLALLAVRLGNMIPHDAAVIYIRQEDELVPQYVKGESYRLFSSLRIPVGQGLSGWVVENDLPILNGNPAVEPGYLNDPQKITSLRSAVSIPLSGQNGPIGALTLYHLKPDAFDHDHLRILLAIRSKAGLAIENSLRFRQARHQAEKDELTGLLNAGSIFRLLEAELKDAADRQSKVAVVVLDLDGFKAANDRFGHLSGNRVLQEIARGLVESSRQTDHVGRLGGDEFAIIAPGLNEDNLSRLIERLRVLGPAAGEAACGAPNIDISFGVALYPTDGSDPESLLEKADQLMYEAKKENRRLRALNVVPLTPDLAKLREATAFPVSSEQKSPCAADAFVCLHGPSARE